MDIYYLLGIVGGFSIITETIKYIIFIFASPIIRNRFHIDSINDRFITNKVCDYIINNNFYASKNEITMKKTYPSGFIIGKWFIAFIEVSSSSYNSIEPNLSICIYSYNDIIGKIKTNDTDDKSLDQTNYKEYEDTCDIIKYNNLNDNDKNNDKEISIYRKIDSWIAADYEVKNIKFKNTFTSSVQYKCVNFITNCLNISNENGFNNSISVLITGKTGIGKSKIAFVLASQINGSVCEDFELISPGYCLESLINITQPKKTNPLILLLDEYDIPIKNIISETVTPHKIYKPPIENKNSCNKFLDNLALYDNVITIFTSNKNLKWFKDKEPSFVRPGRINIHIDLDKTPLNLSILSDESELASKINKMRFNKKLE